MVSGQSGFKGWKYESGAHKGATGSLWRKPRSCPYLGCGSGHAPKSKVEYDTLIQDAQLISTTHLVPELDRTQQKVTTAVHIVHLYVSSRDGKNGRNKEPQKKAMKIIRARVADHFTQIAQTKARCWAEVYYRDWWPFRADQLPSKPCDRSALQKLDTILSGKLVEGGRYFGLV